MGGLAEEHHGHAGLLHDHLREEGGPHLFGALAQGGVWRSMRVVHDSVPLRLA